MTITAMKVAVAFQTMAHTVGMSCSDTAPTARAISAPRLALQPTPSPRGCQMTSTRVKRKTAKAISMASPSARRAAGGGLPRTPFHAV